jgi:chorismate mutase
MSDRVLRAIRGAISVPEDTAEAIGEATAEMLEAILERNSLEHDDLVSILFTATPDLVADFPATAARRAGINDVPLICAQEIPVVGSMERCIRAMVHCYAPVSRPVRHVYLGKARQLRLDLPE